MRLSEIKDWGVFADGIALPFWILLVLYSIYEIRIGNPRAWLVMIIIGTALIIDSTLVFDHYNKKKRFW